MKILEVANHYKIPIISDEVYYGLSFDDSRPFHSFGNLTSDVPIIVNLTSLHLSVLELFQRSTFFLDGDLVGQLSITTMGILTK